MTSVRSSRPTSELRRRQTIDLDALMQANIVRVFNERNSDRRPHTRRLRTPRTQLLRPRDRRDRTEASRSLQLATQLAADFVFTRRHAVGTTAPRASSGGGPPMALCLTGTDSHY